MVCRIPYEGELDEPHRDDVGGFVNTIVVEEPKKGSEGRSLAYTFPCYVILLYLLVDA